MQAYARFGRSADQIPEARAFVRETLFRWGESSVVNDALLVTSELFTNAVLHGSGRIDIYVTLDPEALRIAVVDDGRRTPDRWPRLGATPRLADAACGSSMPSRPPGGTTSTRSAGPGCGRKWCASRRPGPQAAAGGPLSAVVRSPGAPGPWRPRR